MHVVGHHVDLTAMTGATVSAGDPTDTCSTPSATLLAIFGGDNHVHEFWCGKPVQVIAGARGHD